ncbi:uncharacterized protein [Acropora muricata]|uniref:uncharacterized protein n=1 Tax=Acropora muricata TaxID=159855 RepID=UPI0034E3F419
MTRILQFRNNMAAHWIANVDSFFDSLVRIIRRTRGPLSTANWRTLDFEILIGSMGNIRGAINVRSLHADFEIDGQNSSPSLSTSIDRTGRKGRPRYIITETQIRMLREEGFRCVDVARIQGISPITLRRRRTEFEIPVRDNLDDIPDNELDNLVSGIALDVTPQRIKEEQPFIEDNGCIGNESTFYILGGTHYLSALRKVFQDKTKKCLVNAAIYVDLTEEEILWLGTQHSNKQHQFRQISAQDYIINFRRLLCLTT